MTETTVAIEETAPGVVTLRLQRHDQLNALTDPMMDALRAAIARIDADAGCRVVILTGAGRGFCAGLDLRANVAAHGHERHDADAAMRLQELYAGTIPLLRRLRQPLIAAVNGVAVGAGLALALAADIRIAARSARFLVGAVKMGLSAGECGISYHLPRLIGAGRAFELMLTGRAVDAEEALRIGLVTELADDTDLAAVALRTAQTIAANSPFSIKHSKQVMWANLDAAGLEAALELENHVQTVAMLTEDFTEALDAFAAKRPPSFRGR